MTIASELLSFAAQNAWANISQDHQLVLRPHPITSHRGTLGSYTNTKVGITYSVPNNDNRWVLFEYSSMFPSVLGIDETLMNWNVITDVMARNDLIVMPLLEQQLVDLTGMYVMVRQNGGMVFAVNQKTNKDLLTADSIESFHIRFYSNAYFSTDDGAALDGIAADGIYITDDVQEAADLIDEVNDSDMVDSGNLIWFHNGYYVETPDTSTMNLKDTLQYLWDSSGIRYIDMYLDNMASFTSTKDSNVSKLLFFSPEYMARIFLYYDDVDFYVCSKDEDDVVTGLFYDRLYARNLEQVTRSDWSFDSNRIDDLVTAHSADMNTDNIFIRAFLRHSVNPDAQIPDGTYLIDLYLLDRADRYELLTGSVGSYTDWKASALENSDFNTWLGLEENSLTTDAVKGVLNFYGAQQALQIPTASENSDTVWSLPLLAQSGCVVVEFDSDGLYAGYTQVDGGASSYTAQYDGANILVFCGSPITRASQLDITQDSGSDKVGTYDEERFIQATGGDWSIAEQDTHYSWETGDTYVTWADTTTGHEICKRSAGSILVREFTITYAQIGNGFDIFSDGSTPTTGFSFGRYQVWFDGHRGINGLDYTIDEDNWKIYINSIEWTDDEAENTEKMTVFMVACGLPNDTESGCSGFVVDGMVNHDDEVTLVEGRNFNLFLEGAYVPDYTTSVYLAETYRGEYSITFSTSSVSAFAEGLAYDEGTPVTYRNALYVAPSGGVVSRAVFTADDWQRVWSTAYYSITDQDGVYAYLYVQDDTIMYQIAYEDDATVTWGEPTEVTSDLEFNAVKGLPVDSEADTGTAYLFSATPNVVSRLSISPFTETLSEAKEITETLSDLLTEVYPQYESDAVVSNPNQYDVVSPFMWAVKEALLSGDIEISVTSVSSALADNLTVDYQDLLDFDPCYDADGDKDFTYIACYSHGENDAISVSNTQMALLAQLNVLFFDSRIQVNRDFNIDTSDDDSDS